MSATTVKLLQAASEIVGGNKELADRFGICESTLGVFLADRIELPAPLLLCAIDVIVDDRSSTRSPPVQPAVQSLQGVAEQ